MEIVLQGKQGTAKVVGVPVYASRPLGPVMISVGVAPDTAVDDLWPTLTYNENVGRKAPISHQYDKELSQRLQHRLKDV